MNVWAVFGMEASDHDSACSFRYHVGEFTYDVQRKIVQSIRADAKRREIELREIICYPLSTDRETTHGMMRWVDGSYCIHLWSAQYGMNVAGL